MTQQNPLDLTGNLSANPLAELFVEFRDARLDGSIRVTRGDTRGVLYFRTGSVIYAASNKREHRLLNVLLDQNKLSPDDLRELPRVANDVELTALLLSRGVLTKEEVDSVVITQVERIIVEFLSWTEGEWHYSPLVRSRQDVAFNTDVDKLLIDYGRCIPIKSVVGRFRSVREKFAKIEESPADVFLQGHERFVLNAFKGEPRTISELTLDCGLPENGFLHTLYVLWLGGFVQRMSWNTVLSQKYLSTVQSARVKRTQQARSVKIAPSPSNGDVPDVTVDDAIPRDPAQAEISLEDYLARVEQGTTYYDYLGVASKAGIQEIRGSYFQLAKLFHPDRFHREEAETLRRVQASFSKVQAAYETLRAAESREEYDMRYRKELETREKLRAQGISAGSGITPRAEQSLKSFEAGLGLLLEGDYESAIPALARAAHYNPDNALYRAYFGKALSSDRDQLHKAEAEMQSAAKLDPKNEKIRLMLVESFIDNNLLKRAEGELTRFLQLVPESSKAKRMLEKVAQR